MARILRGMKGSLASLHRGGVGVSRPPPVLPLSAVAVSLGLGLVSVQFSKGLQGFSAVAVVCLLYRHFWPCSAGGFSDYVQIWPFLASYGLSAGLSFVGRVFPWAGWRLWLVGLFLGLLFLLPACGVHLQRGKGRFYPYLLPCLSVSLSVSLSLRGLPFVSVSMRKKETALCVGCFSLGGGRVCFLLLSK